MPTTAWSVARTDILRPLGLVEAATTTNIPGTGTTVVSTNLADRYTVDDEFIGWYCMLLNDSDGSTSSNNGTIRRVTDYTASNGTLTLASGSGNLTAEDEAIDFILVRFNPAQVQAVFNRVRTNVFPQLAIVRDHQPLVTGQVQRRFQLPTTTVGKPLQVWLGEWPDAASFTENQFTDPGFELWTTSTNPTNWTESGTGVTVTQEQQTTSPRNYAVFRGQNSAALLGPSSGTGSLSENVTPSVATESSEINVGVAVYSNYASLISAMASGSGNVGTTHGGTGWEILTASALLAATDTATGNCGVFVAAGTARVFFVDEAILTVGQSEPIVPVWDPLTNWDWIPNAGGASNNGYIEFPYDLPEHHVLRVISSDYLSSVSADTDTFEIDGELLEPVYDAVRAELLQEVGNVGLLKESERAFWFGQAAFYRNRSASAIQHRYISVPNRRIKAPDMGAPAGRRRRIAQ